MRKPAIIKSWLTPEELLSWLKEAPTVEAYQKRLAIWLTYIGPFHAQEVADMLGVSKQAVWLWLGQYNKHGPTGLGRKGRGGRRWSLLSWDEEETLLKSLEQRAIAGELLTAKQLLPEISEAVGQEVSLGYVYSLFRRHRWRKLGPRPRHVKAKREMQEEFKKNCQISSEKK
jgi:transposase